MRALCLIAAMAALAACGSVTFQGSEPPAQAPMDVALERHEARQRADAERLHRCRMGETGVERDDRECRRDQR